MIKLRSRTSSIGGVETSAERASSLFEGGGGARDCSHPTLIAFALSHDDVYLRIIKMFLLSYSRIS
jgi:hypothetical protein